MLSTAKVFIILFSIKMTLSAGVFRYHRVARRGISIYSLYLEDKFQCLRACYEERDCAFVEHREVCSMVNEEGFCRLSRQGDNETVEGFTFSREETDASCKLIEIPDFDVSFQRIPGQNNFARVKCSTMPDVAVLQPYDQEKYRFFILDSTKIPTDWIASDFRLFFSKKAEESCTPVPVFHKANLRRLYFGDIYNTTGYYFYNAYAFTDLCVSPTGECLGVQEIQEYVDTQGNFFYDKPGREDMANSDLGQNFFISGKKH